MDGVETLLVDGYISQTFRSRAAEQYFLKLLESTSIPSYATLPSTGRGGCFFFVYSVPPHIAACFPNLPGRLLLDRGIMVRGTVVPQKMWSPRSAIGIRQYVERAELQMPVFFEGRDGGSAFLWRHRLIVGVMLFETRMTPHRWVQKRRHISA